MYLATNLICIVKQAIKKVATFNKYMELFSFSLCNCIFFRVTLCRILKLFHIYVQNLFKIMVNKLVIQWNNKYAQGSLYTINIWRLLLLIECRVVIQAIVNETSNGKSLP